MLLRIGCLAMDRVSLVSNIFSSPRGGRCEVLELYILRHPVFLLTDSTATAVL